ncbi:MAG: chemotaxis protein CheX [Gammaproteobacteria bacterium]|nr:MAG: chemotaxis protein CheX [Gammaproteobacteria bacterium]
MRANFMNPFLKAAQSVLATEVGAEVKRGDVTLESNCYTPEDVTVLLSVVGDVQGIVMYGMGIPMALALISQMLGEEHQEFDDLAQSGIAEMGNVITGIATTHLAEAGYQCSISVPTLVVGRNTMLSTLDFKRLVVPLLTDYGPLSIHLALREAPNLERQAVKFKRTVDSRAGIQQMY